MFFEAIRLDYVQKDPDDLPQKEIQGAKKDWLIIVFLYKLSSSLSV